MSDGLRELFEHKPATERKGPVECLGSGSSMAAPFR